MDEIDDLIHQTTTALSQGRFYSAKNESEKALRCYVRAHELTTQIKRREVIRSWNAKYRCE